MRQDAQAPAPVEAQVAFVRRAQRGYVESGARVDGMDDGAGRLRPFV